MSGGGRRRRRLWALAGFVLSALCLGGFVVLRLALLPPNLSPLPLLDIAASSRLLVDWQIAAMDKHPEICAAVLAQTPSIQAAMIPDRPVQDRCGWTNAVRLTEAAGARFSGRPLTCGAAGAAALWVAASVQPAAKRHFGAPVVAVEDMGTYNCRNIAGTDRRSQHATANAIDIAAFRLSDGQRIAVKRSWGADGPKGAFLDEVFAAACRPFRIVLGPDYNAAHADHFHLDRGALAICR